jgi:hypothetical protein
MGNWCEEQLSGLSGQEYRMALVVFLRGVNVGGHRTFRPSLLTRRLRRYDAVNIGAAGTLLIRRPITRTALRAAVKRLLPFDTHVTVCHGREILGLLADHPFGGRPAQPDIVRFVSILIRRPRSTPPLPLSLPTTGPWLLRIVEQRDRFVFGVYRRQMKAIGHLGAIDRLFGVPATTRNWNTITAIGALLTAQAGGTRGMNSSARQRP